VGVLLMLLACGWVGSGLAQQMYISYRLNKEVQALSADNDRIASTNHGYAQQLMAVSSSAGAEEQARLHNYVKPDEKVYVIELPSPSPSPSPRAKPASGNQSHNSNWWDGIIRVLTFPFHS
jgi:cell division protein FtsB